MTPDKDLSARLAELPSHWANTAPKPHYRSEELLPIVYADPGSNGWYYRERKPDSVTAYVRLDLHDRAVQDAVAKAVEAERLECARRANRVPLFGNSSAEQHASLEMACAIRDAILPDADFMEMCRDEAAIRSRGVEG